MKKEAKKVLKKYTDLWDELNKVTEEYKAIYYQDCYDYCYPKALEYVKDTYNKDASKIADKIKKYINTAIGIQLDYLTNNEIQEDIDLTDVWRSVQSEIEDFYEFESDGSEELDEEEIKRLTIEYLDRGAYMERFMYAYWFEDKEVTAEEYLNRALEEGSIKELIKFLQPATMTEEGIARSISNFLCDQLDDVRDFYNVYWE